MAHLAEVRLGTHHIHASSHGLKMVRVDAVPDPAQVVDLQTLRDWAYE